MDRSSFCAAEVQVETRGRVSFKTLPFFVSQLRVAGFASGSQELEVWSCTDGRVLSEQIWVGNGTNETNHMKRTNEPAFLLAYEVPFKLRSHLCMTSFTSISGSRFAVS